MDSPTRVVIAFLLLISASVSANEPEELKDVGAWMTYYYLHPKPDQVALALKTIDAEGYFENPDVQAPLSGFFAEIFRSNPGKIEAWIKPYHGRRRIHILYSALWVADSPQSKAALESLAAAAPDDAEIIKPLLTRSAPSLESTTVDSPAVLDYFWGRFMASGSETPVLLVIDQMKLAKTKGNVALLMIGGAAEWSVAANARQHERVLSIVKSRASTADGATREMLEEILKRVESEGTRQ